MNEVKIVSGRTIRLLGAHFILAFWVLIHFVHTPVSREYLLWHVPVSVMLLHLFIFRQVYSLLLQPILRNEYYTI
jgi:uncharacterized membrane protein